MEVDRGLAGEGGSVPVWLVRLDRFIAGRAVLAVALVWGWAEATCFFIVPDVLLTLIACRRLRPALLAGVAALAGALLGGVMMVALGAHMPQTTRRLLDGIPGIGPALMAAVQLELERHGVAALMLGPLRGVPYKIYAVEWGARHGDMAAFMLVSIPARYARFLLTTLAARGIAALLGARRAAITFVLWALFWTIFYAAYLSRMGW